MGIDDVIRQVKRQLYDRGEVESKIATEGAWPYMDGRAIPDKKFGQVTVISKITGHKELTTRIVYLGRQDEEPEESSKNLKELVRATEMEIAVTLRGRLFTVCPRHTAIDIIRFCHNVPAQD